MKTPKLYLRYNTNPKVVIASVFRSGINHPYLILTREEHDATEICWIDPMFVGRLRDMPGLKEHLIPERLNVYHGKVYRSEMN